MVIERQYRLLEVSRLSGYSVSALRKKILHRELGYRKSGRIVTIPEGELVKLLGEFRPAVERTEPAR